LLGATIVALAVLVSEYLVIPFRFVDGIMEACQRYSTPR
jgi:hypothetical protein